MIVSAMNTNTADTRIGIQSAERPTIGLPPGIVGGGNGGSVTAMRPLYETQKIGKGWTISRVTHPPRLAYLLNPSARSGSTALDRLSIHPYKHTINPINP